MPASRASASVSPTAATCGSVNVTRGTAPWSATVDDVATGDHVAGEPALVLAHVGERATPVSRRPRRATRPAPLRTRSRSSTSEPNRPDRDRPSRARVEAVRRRADPATSNSSASISRPSPSVGARPSVVARRRGRPHARSDRDALGLERGGELVAGERLLPGQQPRPALDHRDLVAPEPSERLGHLDPDRSPAEHEEAARHRARRRRVAVVPRPDIGEPVDRRASPASCRWPARRPSWRSSRRAPASVSTSTARSPSRRPSPRTSSMPFDSSQGICVAIAPRAGHVVALREGRGDIDRAGDRLGGAGHPSRGRDDVARPHQGLGRDASPERALAADEPRFHDRDAESVRRRIAPRRSRRAGPPPITMTSKPSLTSTSSVDERVRCSLR